MRGGEGELEIGDRAGIGVGRRQLTRIFALEGNIAGPEDCRTAIALDRLRIVLASGLRHDYSSVLLLREIHAATRVRSRAPLSEDRR
jgi:hypothetical protein